MKGAGACNQIGYWIPFSFRKMEALYGSHQKYEENVFAGVDKLVQERWLLNDDAEKLKAELRAKWSE